MFLKKLWYFFCGVFCLNSLYDALQDAYSVHNVQVEKFGNENLNFSVCIFLEDEEMVKDFKVSENSYSFTVSQLVESTCLDLFDEQFCKESIYLSKSYLYNYHACLSFDINHFDTIMKNLTSKKFTIFVFYDEKSEIYFYQSVLGTFSDKLYDNPFDIHLTYHRINLLEKPYETGCFDYANRHLGFKTKENVFSKGSCLLECFKQKSRSLRYYYSTKDDGNIDFYDYELSNLKKIEWQIINANLSSQYLSEDEENACKKLCSIKGCEITFYLTKWNRNSNVRDFNLTYDVLVHSTNPSYSFLYILFDFLGLVSLFFNISFYQTTPYFMKRLFLRFFGQHRPIFTKFYWILKLIVFIICLSFLVWISAYLIVQFIKEDYQQLEGFDFPTQIIPFQLIICVPVQVLIKNQEKLNIEKEVSLLQQNSFTQLEKLTDFNNFEKGINSMFIKYATKEKKIKYTIDKNIVIFRSYKYLADNQTEFNFLLRCFRLDFDFVESRYEMLYGLSDLEFVLDFNWYVVYPISLNHNLTAMEHNLVKDPYFSKTTKDKKINCSHYRNEQFNCNSKFECRDQCSNLLHLQKYKNLTVLSVVYKDKIHHWHSLDQVHFINYFDKEIKSECNQKFRDVNCHIDYFSVSKDVRVNLRNSKFRIRLHYKHFTVIDNPVITLPDLIFNNLFNFVCVFIGLNLPKFFSLIFVVLRRQRLLRTYLILNYIKVLVCLLGFFTHLYFIFFNSLNEDLIKIQEYSYSDKILELPNLIICFKFDQSRVDKNRLLSVSYLNELTKDLNMSFFQRVSFLDEDYNLRDYYPSKAHEEKGLEKIYWFYFLDLKCFEFSFSPIKNDRFLYLLNYMNFVNFKFHRETILTFYNRTYDFNFYIMNRKKHTAELNEIIEVNFKYYDGNRSTMIVLNQILYRIQVEDKLSFLRQPFSIFYGESVNLDDATEYIGTIKRDLKKWNLGTSEIPTYGNEDDLELETIYDNELFDQYYSQIKNVSDQNSFRIINYKREFFLSSTFEKEKSFDYEHDFRLFLNPFFNTVRLKNRNSHSKFILIELTCLNFYYNFSIFDLHLYAKKLLKLFLKFYHFFVMLRACLRRKSDSLLLRR